MNTTKMKALAIIVLLLNAGAGAQEEEWLFPNSAGSFRVDRNVRDFSHAHRVMVGWVDEHCDKSPLKLVNFKNNPKLVKQQLKEKPPHWFWPLLMGRDTESTSLAVRSDNLYLSAFTSRTGQWYRFSVDDPDLYVIQDAIDLGFRNNYATLLGDGTDRPVEELLADLEIGQSAVLDSIGVANGYKVWRTRESHIKLASATLNVVFIESLRFPYIRQRIHDVWLSRNPGKLGKRGAKLLGEWKDISCALIIWDQNPDKDNWDNKHAEKLKKEFPEGLGITTPEQARAEIFPVLVSESC